MDLEDLIGVIAKSYHKEPRNKVFANEELLIASVLEEIDVEITGPQLRGVIDKFIAGEMNEPEQMVYDAAVYACSVLARLCFSEDPDEDAEVDFQITWIENDDASYSAEVRPC